MGKLSNFFASRAFAGINEGTPVYGANVHRAARATGSYLSQRYGCTPISIALLERLRTEPHQTELFLEAVKGAAESTLINAQPTAETHLWDLLACYTQHQRDNTDLSRNELDAQIARVSDLLPIVGTRYHSALATFQDRNWTLVEESIATHTDQLYHSAHDLLQYSYHLPQGDTLFAQDRGAPTRQKVIAEVQAAAEKFLTEIPASSHTISVSKLLGLGQTPDPQSDLQLGTLFDRLTVALLGSLRTRHDRRGPLVA